MYSESELDAAVSDGAIAPEAATAFRAHVAAHRAAPAADEESFRLITGFNDVFVSIAATLLLVAVGWIGQIIPFPPGYDGMRPLAGLFVAGAGWGLAEYFTRRRRMALPSILLLIAFVGGVFVTVVSLLLPVAGGERALDDQSLVMTLVAASAAVAGGAAWLHWQRFQVPITVAAGIAAVVTVAAALAESAQRLTQPVVFFAGLGVFALAMRWDMSDRARQTRRSDVAFWLHLLAAPLIVHPAFTALSGAGGTAAALPVLLLYLALAAVALAIDRRALMVSALAYVLFAISRLFEQAGAVSLSVALTALVIGSALLLLSAFWQAARGLVLGPLPPAWRDRLPPVGARYPATPRPA